MPRIVAFIAAILLVAPLYADRLELVNGDTITGRIISMSSDTILIETDYGTLEVSRSAVISGAFGLVADEPDDLLFYFNFNGVLADSVGHYVAANNGMRFSADATGLPQAALRSDGTGTYLSIASSEEIDSLNELTVMFDIRLEDTGTTQYLISKWTRAESETADGKFTLQTAGGNLTLYVVAADGSYHRATARSVLTEGEWHSVALTFSRGRSLIYVDGVQVASTRFSFTELFADTAPILVMTAESQTGDPYAYYNCVGSIDELRLYSRALSPDEIAAISTVVLVEE